MNKRGSKSTLRPPAFYTCVTLAVVFFCGIAPLTAGATDRDAWREGFTLIKLSTDDIASLHAAREVIQESGGKVAIMLPPSILLGWVPPELHSDLIGRKGIDGIYLTEIIEEEVAGDDKTAKSAIEYFNSVVTGEREEIVTEKDHPGSFDEAWSCVPFGEQQENYRQLLESMGFDPQSLQKETLDPRLIAAADGNNDYMTGTVTVSLLFVESDGSGADADEFTWIAEDENDMVAWIIDGLAWWSNEAGDYGCRDEYSNPIDCWVTFLVQPYKATEDTRTHQWVEPIRHPGSTPTTYRDIWVGAIMDNFGVPGFFPDLRVQEFNAIQRSTFHTDRAYSAFFVCNPPAQGAPSTFTDGYCAFAVNWLGGETPYFVALYKNCGFDPSYMNWRVFAHETGHIFGACDEYSICGGSLGNCPGCNNGVENGNCVNCVTSQEPCIMTGANVPELCSFTPSHVGWLGTTVAPTERRIRGFVLDGGAGVGDVPVELYDQGEVCATQSTVTLADGSYEFYVEANPFWSGSIKALPYGNGKRYQPETREYTNLTGNLSNQNFDVVAQPTAWDEFGGPEGIAVSAVDCHTSLNQSYLSGYGRTLEATTDGSNGAIIAWCDKRSGGTQVYAQRTTATGEILWDGQGVLLGGAGGSLDGQPAVVPTSDGGAIVVWYGQANSLFAQRLDATGNIQWTPGPTTFGLINMTAAGTLDAVSDGADGVFVAWTNYSMGISIQRVNADGSIDWPTNGVQLSATGMMPSIVGDGIGGAIVAWTENYLNPFAQRVDQYGNIVWTSGPILLYSGPAVSALFPDICSDGAEGAIVTWAADDNGNQVQAQRVNKLGQRPWGLEGRVICDANDTAFQQIVSDGAGGAIIVWEDKRNYGTTGIDLYASRVTGDGDIAYPWQANGNPLCTAAGDQQDVRIAPGHVSGEFIIVWKDDRPEASTDIYAEKLLADGSTGWGEDGSGILFAAAPEAQSRPKIVMTQAGGPLVVWRDGRDARQDVYAKRFLEVEIKAFVKHANQSLDPMPAYWMNSCPQGDGESYLVEIDFDDTYGLGSITAAELTIGDALDGVKLFGTPVVADGDADATNGWTTTFTHSNVSGCGRDDVPVYRSGHLVGYAPIKVHSPDINLIGTSEGVVDAKDQRAMSKAYGGCVPQTKYNICLDFFMYPPPVLPCVDEADKIFFDSHVGHLYTPPGGARSPAVLTLKENDLTTHLEQNVPNPFNPVTTIGFSIAEASHISIRVYDIHGGLVRTLVDEFRSPNAYQVRWDGTDNNGNRVSSGVYFYRMIAGEFSMNRKLVLLK